MNGMRDPEAILAAWLEDGPTELPESTRRAIAVNTRTTHQTRYPIWVPWRPFAMTLFARIAAAVVVVTIAAGGALYLLAPGGGVGGRPVPTAPAPSPSPTPATSPSPNPLDTTTWKTYVSNRYGFSIAHPADWEEHPADHTWTLAKDTDWLNTAAEVFIKTTPNEGVRVSAWSVPVEPGTSLEAWMQAYCPKETESCAGQDRAITATIDGHRGLLVTFPADSQAFVLVDNRIYAVAVWWADADPSMAKYGGSRRLLEAFLSTMHLLPGGPSPSATARPSS